MTGRRQIPVMTLPGVLIGPAQGAEVLEVANRLRILRCTSV